MFSFFSTQKVKRVLLAGLVLVLLAGFLSGCKNEVEDESTTGLPSSLVGKWVSSYGDFYEIAGSGNTGTLKYDTNGYGISQGNIRDVTNFNDKSGVIIVQYTSGHTNTAKPFGAVYYMNLVPGVSIGLSNAWDATAADYDANTATLQEAIGKFTQGNIGTYLDVGQVPTYTKQ